MVAGRRVTDDAALEVAKMVYAGQLNVDLLAALRAHRVQAVGLSGVDADLITAHRRPPVQVVDDAGKTAQGGLWPRGRHRPGGSPDPRHPDGSALRPGRGQPGRRRRRRGVQRERRHGRRVAGRGHAGAEADLPDRRARRAAGPERPLHPGDLRRSGRPRRPHGERCADRRHASQGGGLHPGRHRRGRAHPHHRRARARRAPARGLHRRAAAGP